MAKFLRITVVIIVVVLDLLLIIPSLQLKNKPTMAELLEQSRLSADEISMTAQDFYDKVRLCLTYPKQELSAEDTGGSEMELYTDGDIAGDDALDTLAVTYLADGVQYEFYDSAANILYSSTVPLEATPDKVTAADFEKAGISALDMEKFRELTS